MEDNQQQELTPMEVEHSKEDLSAEEKLLKRLLFEWRNLDDCFIPPDQRKLYKDTFEHYLTAQAQQEALERDQAGGKKVLASSKPTKKR